MSSFKSFPSSTVQDFTKERKPSEKAGDKPAMKTGADDLEARMQQAMGRVVIMNRLRLDEIGDPKELEPKVEKIMPQLSDDEKKAVAAYMKRLLEDEQ